MRFDITRYETLVLETLDAMGPSFAFNMLQGFVPEVRDEVMERLLGRLKAAPASVKSAR